MQIRDWNEELLNTDYYYFIKRCPCIMRATDYFHTHTQNSTLNTQRCDYCAANSDVLHFTNSGLLVIRVQYHNTPSANTANTVIHEVASADLCYVPNLFFLFFQWPSIRGHLAHEEFCIPNCTGAGHNVLLILRNPGGTCRDIYGREQLYPALSKPMLI
jgi:hypothetical protein